MPLFESQPKVEVDCPEHGTQGVGRVCIHIAHAVDRNEKVGFYECEDTGYARPHAWCAQCERALDGRDREAFMQWFNDADFKTFCCRCWDEAKQVCEVIDNTLQTPATDIRTDLPATTPSLNVAKVFNKVLNRLKSAARKYDSN